MKGVDTIQIIKTKSFDLAISTKGDKNSKRIVICLPGRLDTKDYACFTSHLDFFANQGFFAVSFDPPGTWDSPGGIELFTTTNYIKAVNELIEYFGNKPTLLLGHSRGGTVSILTGSSNAHVVGFVVIMATYGAATVDSPDELTIQTGVKMSYRDLPPGTTKTSEQKVFALPITYFKDSQQYNPVETLKKCTKPKLLIYGTHDRYTKPETVKEVFDVIPEPKMIHELDSDHDYRYHPEIIEEVNQTVAQFVDIYLKS